MNGCPNKKKVSFKFKLGNFFFKMLVGKRAISSVIVVLIMALLVIVSVGVIWVTMGTLIRDGSQRVELGQKCLSAEINYVRIKDVEGGYELTLSRRDRGEDLGGIKIVLLNGTHNTEVISPEEFRDMKPLETKTGFIETNLISVSEIHWTPYFMSSSEKELVCEETNVKQIEIFFHSQGGIEIDPEELIFISTCEELQNMNQNLNANYSLTRDIDCFDTIHWVWDNDKGYGFEPIGNSTHYFEGNLNGNGFVISNLYVNTSLQDRIGGIFGFVGRDSLIENIGLIDINVSNSTFVGGLIGTNEGTVLNCFIKGGTVQGLNYVGGLVGYNHGNILNSYARVNVVSTNPHSENTYVGGITSFNAQPVGGPISSVINSFFVGDISYSVEEYVYWGGVIGINNEGSFVSNLSWHSTENNPPSCYYEFSDQGLNPSNESCILVTGAEHPPYFFDKDNSPLFYWDFENIWFEQTQDYPILKRYISIFNCTQLQNIKEDLTSSYILMNNIDCSNTINWNNGQGFEPIGNFTHHFEGNFDGNGFIINSLYINKSDISSIKLGLFGHIQNSTIKNVSLENVKLNCINCINCISGSLVAVVYGSNIENCYSTGSVSGINHVGGLIGSIHDSNISSSSFVGSVSGISDVGGLVGSAENSKISNCYSNVNVSGEELVGGLMGNNNYFSEIVNSYSTGSVSGGVSVGGLTGRISANSNVFNSFSTCSVSGESLIGGLVGSNLGNIFNSYWHNHSGNPDNCYNGLEGNCTTILNHPPYFYIIDNSPMNEWDFENVWSSLNNGINYPFLN